jgi:hypothetical protein
MMIIKQPPCSLSTFLPIAIAGAAMVFGCVAALGCGTIEFQPSDPSYFVVDAGAFAFRDGSYTDTPETELLWDPHRPYNKYLWDDLEFEYATDEAVNIVQGAGVAVTALGVLVVLGLSCAPSLFPIWRSLLGLLLVLHVAVLLKFLVVILLVFPITVHIVVIAIFVLFTTPTLCLLFDTILAVLDPLFASKVPGCAYLARFLTSSLGEEAVQRIALAGNETVLAT